MSLSRNTLLIFAAIAMLLVGSCKEDMEVPPLWVPAMGFEYQQKVMLNAFTDVENFYSIGPYAFSDIVIDDFGNLQVNHNQLLFNYPFDLRLPLSTKIFVGPTNSDGVLQFQSTENPIANATGIRISAFDYDPDFAAFEFPVFPFEAMVFNNNEQLLVPYAYFDHSNPANPAVADDIRFLLVDLTVTINQNQDFVDTLRCQRLDLPGFSGPLTSVHSVDSYFFVANNSGSWKIEGNGTARKVSTQNLSRIIRQADLYAFTADAMMKSTDLGETWTTFISTTEPYRLYNFSMVNGVLIGFTGDEVYECTISSNDFTTRRIDTSPLDGNVIRDITYYKEKVFATTLSGTYLTSPGLFFQYLE